MFENYTERARRAIFFARYEASQLGSPYIETEHLLLGIFREDRRLTTRLFPRASIDEVRRQVEGHLGVRPKTSTSVDLPLSNESKRVLAYAAEEAGQLSHKQVRIGHLLLGFLREERCFAAEILRAHGLQMSTVREGLEHPESGTRTPPYSSGPNTSRLAVVSEPTGADIEIDGRFLGHTPAFLNLPSGEQVIRITKDGFELWERKVELLRAARQSISANLVRVPE